MSEHACPKCGSEIRLTTHHRIEFVCGSRMMIAEASLVESGRCLRRQLAAEAVKAVKQEGLDTLSFFVGFNIASVLAADIAREALSSAPQERENAINCDDSDLADAWEDAAERVLADAPSEEEGDDHGRMVEALREAFVILSEVAEGSEQCEEADAWMGRHKRTLITALRGGGQ